MREGTAVILPAGLEEVFPICPRNEDVALRGTLRLRQHSSISSRRLVEVTESLFITARMVLKMEFLDCLIAQEGVWQTSIEDPFHTICRAGERLYNHAQIAIAVAWKVVR
jgi:hypothetical protein